MEARPPQIPPLWLSPVSGFLVLTCRAWQALVFFPCGFFFFKQTKLIFSLLQIAADGNKGTDMQPGECQTCLEMPQPLLMRRLACSTICQGCSFIINQLGRRHELKCHQKRDNSSLLNAVQLFQGEFVNRN